MLRADSGFAREVLMAWCEANGVDYLFGLARNRCLLAAIEAELDEARAEHQQTGKAARRFADFTYATRGLRRIALADTDLAQATCASIRLKFLKIRARVTVSVRRVKIAMASACPQQATFALAHARLRAPPG